MTTMFFPLLRVVPILTIALVSCALGQSRKLSLHHYTSANGLLSDAVTEVFQDSRGHLLIGTAEGLSAFDGYSFTHYRTRDGLPSNFIRCIYEQRTSPGIVWLGTTNGLAKSSGKHFSSIQLDVTERSRLISSIREDARGRLWCGTLGGLYVTWHDSVARVDLGVEVAGHITLLGEREDTVMWVAVDNLLLAISPSLEVIHRTRLSPLSDNHVTGALLDKSGGMWVGLSDNTISLYHSGRLVQRRRISSGVVTHLMEGPDSVLYVCTVNGVFSIPMNRFPVDEFEHIGVQNGLPNNRVIGGTVDREGSLWLLCDGAGIVQLTQTAVQEWTVPGIPETYNNMRATSDADDHFWVVSGDSLVEFERAPGESWRTHKHGVKTDPAMGKLTSVVCDSWNRLWVGFTGFTIRCYSIQRDKDRRTRLLPDHSVGIPRSGFPFLHAFLVDRNDRLWCSNGLVMDHYKNRVIKRYGLPDGIPEGDIRTLAEDRSGNIYFGGYTRGIAVVPRGSLDSSVKILTPATGLPTGFVRAFCEGPEGSMWVGTRYGGCLILNRDSIRVITTADGLPSDAIWSIARDERGMMWLGTSMGLVAVDPVTLQPDPASGNLVGEPVPGLGVSRAGEIWFVTRASFGVLDVDHLRTPLAVPDAHIPGMTVDGQPVEISGHMKFPYDRSRFSFDFLAMTLRDIQKIRYQYRLLDLESEWSTPAAQRTVTYASLPHGGYTFEVRATRHGTDAYGKADAVSFVINPPYWTTWWFIVLSTCTLAGGLFFTYRRRIKTLKNEKRLQQEFSRRLLESEEGERKRIAGELHDSLVQDLLVAKNRSLMGLKNVHDAQRARRELEEISSVLGVALEEVRGIAHNLRPYQLDRLGFSKAVRSLVSKLGESTTLQFHTEVHDVDEHLDATMTIQLYRILQEVLNNIMKHSEATSASVTLTHDGSWVELRIADNGKGISVKDLSPGGFGFDGISQRASLMRGTSRISSAPGEGTTVVVRVPIDITHDAKEDHSTHRG